MKSIQNQYRDLKEGKMSQTNFMRNLRMTMPQYVTNVTSFNDAVRILKSKSIITETQENIEEVSNDRAFDVAKKLRDEYNMDEEGVYVYLVDDMGLDNMTAQSVVDQVFGGGNDEDAGLEDLLAQYGEEESGKYTKFDDYEGGISEAKKAKKKKEPKAELHPNQIHPQELRMGIKVELEHTDDLDKAKKIALDHLAENPFYYTALKLAGVESPSAPKAKAPVEKKAKKKGDKIELVDLVNQMQKVKMPKADEKKKLKEARYNIMGEPNAAAKQAMQFVDGNATLKALSDDIEIQQSGDEALLRYGYWEILPAEAVEKLKLQFNVEVDGDFDEDTGELTFYRLTPIRRNYGSKDLGASFEKFKSSLEEVVREVLAEMQSDDQEIDNMAMAMDETFDGRDNLDAKNEE
jgi:hypothetical protein